MKLAPISPADGNRMPLCNLIQIVLVVYELPLQSLPFLQAFNRFSPALKALCHVLIYDNSLQEQSSSCIDPAIEYVHDARNLGLAHAYNVGLNKAKQTGLDWLLLLDHDTLCSEEFFEVFLEELSNHPDANVFLPHLESKGKLLSPVPLFGEMPAYWRKIQIPQQGEMHCKILGYNSGTLLRVSLMERLGGFNLDFPVDYLDFWLYQQLRQQHQQIIILPITLEHHLSLLDMKGIPITRYEKILKAERKYYQFYTSYGNQIMVGLARGFRMMKLLRSQRWDLMRLTIQHIMKLIFRVAKG